MPRQNFTCKLPAELKTELDQRIRDSMYATPGEHAKWLSSLGYKSSRSGISRYARALMDADEVSEEAQKSTYHQSARSSHDRSHLTPKECILIELGELKVRENQLLRRLEAVSGSTDIPEMIISEA